MGLFGMVKVLADSVNGVVPGAVADEHLRLATATVISATVTRYIEIAQSLMHGRPQRQMTVFDFPFGLQPSLSFRRFVHRFAKYTRGCVDSFTLALFYLARLVDSGRIPLDTSSCYRAFTGAFVIAAKFLDDIPHSNRHIAKVAGLETSEVNLIERHTLHLLNFDLAVDAEQPEWHLFHVAVTKWAAISFLDSHKEPMPTDPALVNNIIDEEAVKRAWFLDYKLKTLLIAENFAAIYKMSQQLLDQTLNRQARAQRPPPARTPLGDTEMHDPHDTNDVDMPDKIDDRNTIQRQIHC